MSYLIPLFFVLAVLTYFWCSRSFLSVYTLAFLGVKLISAFVFVLLYSYHYTEGDIFSYANQAETLLAGISNHDFSFYEVLIKDHGYSTGWLLQPRAVFFSKVYLCSSFIALQNVFGIAVVFSVVSWVLLLELHKYIERNEILDSRLLFLGYLLVPSVLFWTSGITKETLCFPLFLICLAHLYQAIKKSFQWQSGAVLFICFLFLYQLRFFYLPFIFVFGFVFFLLTNHKKWYAWLSLSLCGTSYYFCQAYLIPQLRLEYFNEILFNSYHKLYSMSSPGSRFHLPYLDDSLLSSLKAMLASFRFTFFMKFDNLLMALSSIENLILLGAVTLSLIYSRKKSNVVLAIVAFIIVAVCLINVSTPNYGSLSRYRVVYWYPLAVLAVIKIKGFLFLRKPLGVL